MCQLRGSTSPRPLGFLCNTQPIARVHVEQKTHEFSHGTKNEPVTISHFPHHPFKKKARSLSVCETVLHL